MIFPIAAGASTAIALIVKLKIVGAKYADDSDDDDDIRQSTTTTNGNSLWLFNEDDAAWMGWLQSL